MASQDQLLASLDRLANRYREVENQLADPQVLADRKLIAELNQEEAKLEPLARTAGEINSIQKKLSQTQDLIKSETNQEMLELAKTELEVLTTQLNQTIVVAKRVLDQLEKPQGSSLQEGNALLEIRGAAGGDEAKLWARDLLRMYTRYAEAKSWHVQPIDDDVLKINGQNAYGYLSNEAGVHRVQRVPITESQGRIHTSTATVAVLPEVKETTIAINSEEIELETFRSGGPGGQNVNKVNTAVRIRHRSSGISVVCTSERSQHQNRRLALDLLRAKLWQDAEDKRQAEVVDLRRAAVGRGMRAEKIRTYNYPQNRVTDHRLKKSWYQLEAILNGGLDPVIQALVS